jgi:hypothetical protein
MKTRNMLSLIMLALLAGVSVARSEIMDAVNMYQGNSVTGFNYVAASGNFTNATTTQTGDYDFDSNSDDRRTYQGITTVLGAMGNPFASGAASNRTSVVRGGFQMTMMNSSATPVFGLRRITESATVNGDFISLGSGASADPMRLVSAINVAKADFLDGANAANKLSFDNAVNMKARVATVSGANSLVRFLVQNGSDWYISAYSVSAAADMSANGYTQTWYSYNPSSNLLYDNSNLGTGVAGSTLTDIQAFGVIGQSTADVAGAAANNIQFAVSKLSLSLIPAESTKLSLIVLTSL